MVHYVVRALLSIIFRYFLPATTFNSPLDIDAERIKAKRCGQNVYHKMICVYLDIALPAEQEVSLFNVVLLVTSGRYRAISGSRPACGRKRRHRYF